MELERDFRLFLLFVDLVRPRNRIELLEFKFHGRMLLLVLAREVHVAFSSPVLVAHGYEFYEFVL